MHLIFSTDDHMNTDVFDERGRIYYTTSTSSGFTRVTTVTKYSWPDSSSGIPETLGVIEWGRSETTIRFNGPAGAMLEKQSGHSFLGPDQQTYKWKVAMNHCWIQPANSNIELVRSHRKNRGIMKPAHPAYLDVNDQMLSMLDHIILTFVYVEQFRLERKNRRSGGWEVGPISGGINAIMS